MEVEIVSFIDTIRAQQRFAERYKDTQAKNKAIAIAKSEKLPDTTIMNVLYKLKIGHKPPEIAKEINLPVQRVYNVIYRYELIQNDDGSFWYLRKDS